MRFTWMFGDGSHRDLLVDVERVAYSAQIEGGHRLYLPLANGQFDSLDVAGATEEIHAALLGIKPSTLKAYPNAIGWVQTPDLNLPPPWVPLKSGGAK